MQEKWIQSEQEQLISENVLKQRRLRQYFKAWGEVLIQQRNQRFNLLKQYANEQNQQSEINQQNDNNDYDNTYEYDNDNEDQMFNLGLAIKYYQNNILTKSIRGLISYGIMSKKLQQNLSKFYVKFLLKKYLIIINQYKINSINKKLKKSINVTHKQEKSKQSSFQIDKQQSQIGKTNLNATQIYQLYKTTNQLLKKSSPQKSNFTTQKQDQKIMSNTALNFHKNPILNQSRKSQFSTISANLNFQSKRKFRPILELPSIPDIESISKLQNQLKKDQRQRYLEKSPKRFYQSRAQSQTAPYEMNRDVNLAESKVSEIKQKDTVKEIILQILLKQKLISLAIMSGQQFKQGMQYENYRQKTVSSLRKLRELKAN